MQFPTSGEAHRPAISATRRPQRRKRFSGDRLRFEALESRTLQAAGLNQAANLILEDATQVGGNAIEFRYAVTGELRASHVAVAITRSAEAAAGTTIGRLVLQGHDLAPGEHVKKWSANAGSLEIDTARPFVSVRIDPHNRLREASELDNAYTFRKYAIAAIVDGNDSNGVDPGDATGSQWVERLRDRLVSNGFDNVVAYDWSQFSLLPIESNDDVAARDVAALVRLAPERFLDEISASDVVDVQMIGYDRGATVVLNAARSLAESEVTPDSIRDGLLKLTLIDPVFGRGTNYAMQNMSQGGLGSLLAGNNAQFESFVQDTRSIDQNSVGEGLYAVTPTARANMVEVIGQRNPVAALRHLFLHTGGRYASDAGIRRSVAAYMHKAGASANLDSLIHNEAASYQIMAAPGTGVRYYNATLKVSSHRDLIEDFVNRVAAGIGRRKGLGYDETTARFLARPHGAELSPDQWAAYEELILRSTLGETLGEEAATDLQAASAAIASGSTPEAIESIDALIGKLNDSGIVPESVAAQQLAFVLDQARERLSGVVTPAIAGLVKPRLSRGLGKVIPNPRISTGSIMAASEPAESFVETTTTAAPPNSVDLTQSGYMPPVYDQGYVGSCTANATMAVVSYYLAQNYGVSYEPSRMYQYINGLANDQILDTRKDQFYAMATLSDAGCDDIGMTTATQVQGFIPESMQPYPAFANSNSLTQKEINADFKALLNTNSTLPNYQQGLYGQVTYTDLGTDVDSIIAALADGSPVVIGILVTSNFYNLGGGYTSYPMLETPTESTTTNGGHEVVLVGYDNTLQAFIVRNSWGTGENGWGYNGYAYMPYEYYEIENAGNAWIVASANFVQPATPEPFLGDLAAVLAQDGTPDPSDSGVIAINSVPLFEQGPAAPADGTVYTASPNLFGFAPQADIYGSTGYVTPLIFSSADGANFTLEGVGAPAQLGDYTFNTSAAGLPFVPLQDTYSTVPNDTSLSAQTYIGFYNGLIQAPVEGATTWTVTPNLGMIAVTTPASGPSGWLVTSPGVSSLTPGNTVFTVGAGGANGLTVPGYAYSFAMAAAVAPPASST